MAKKAPPVARSMVFRYRWLIGGLSVLIVAAGALYVALQRDGGDDQQVTVTRGNITETVSVTGNTVPTESVDLGFGNSGTISRVYSSVGSVVRKGSVLAELNMSDLYSQEQQALANVAAQYAKLEGLKAGSRPEDIAASQAALDKSEQDLANMYAGIEDSTTDSYAKAKDAVRVQLDEFFSNAESVNPRLTYQSANSQAQFNAESLRADVSIVLNTWQTELNTVNRTDASLDAFLIKNLSYLETIRELVNMLSTTLQVAPGLDATSLAAYKANVTAALNQVNTASKNLNTVRQNIASQKLTVSQAKAQLDLKKAGSTAQDIKAQEAQVANAEAQVQSVRAKLQSSQIVSPISGVVTQFDAKAGQFASPGTTLVSVMSEGAFEIDAQISETDVAKVQVGNTVSMTLDAFTGETFTGSISYIDPAQTTTDGVVGYKIKITFDAKDPRMKSGLTANVDIATRKKDNVLILPQYAILQNDEGTFVRIEENDSIRDVAVTLGIQDREGNTEVLTGVSEGQRVLNIGLKSND